MKKLKIIICILFLFTVIACDDESSSDTFPDQSVLPANQWVRDVKNPVVTGDTTTITNICDPTVVYHDNKFKLWASCVEDDVAYASICYSESADGSIWDPPKIVFSPSLSGTAWDNQKTEVPTVIVDSEEIDADKRFKMWYGGADSGNPDLTKIGYAYSADGQTWDRVSAVDPDENGLVLVPGSTIGDAGVVSDPVVVQKESFYYMWYNSFGADNDILISHATSSDGVNWTKEANNPVMIPDNTWEDGGPGIITKDVSQPSVLYLSKEKVFVMWYGSFDSSVNETYSGIGFASSANGIGWIKDNDNPVFIANTALNGEQIGISTGPAILYLNGQYHLFYCGANDKAQRVINHAVSE